MSELLDSTVKKTIIQDGFCNLPDRIRHVFIDGIIVLALSILLEEVFGMNHLYGITGSINLEALILRLTIYFCYYALMEYFLGFTLGKFLNKTRVISIHNEKPTFAEIAIRTITRLIPVGFLMIVTPYKSFLHDILSKTRTVRIKKKNVVHVNEV